MWQNIEQIMAFRSISISTTHIIFHQSRYRRSMLWYKCIFSTFTPSLRTAFIFRAALRFENKIHGRVYTVVFLTFSHRGSNRFLFYFLFKQLQRWPPKYSSDQLQTLAAEFCTFFCRACCILWNRSVSNKREKTTSKFVLTFSFIRELWSAKNWQCGLP